MEHYIPIALIAACLLSLALVLLSVRRIQKEGLTIRSGDRGHFVRSIEEVKHRQEEERAIRDMDDDASGIHITHSRFGFGKSMMADVEETLMRVKEELELHGFEVVTSTDVAALLPSRRLPAYHMVTVFHRELSGKGVEIEPALGLMEANIIVRRNLGEEIYVECVEPSPLLQHSNDDELVKLASEFRSRLLKTLQAV
jgi:uncharacterized protein (DUF302 family)